MYDPLYNSELVNNEKYFEFTILFSITFGEYLKKLPIDKTKVRSLMRFV